MQQVFLSLFQTGTPVAMDAATKMANAYTNYCRTGLFGTSVPTILPGATALLQATLLNAMATPVSGTPAKFAQAWANGVQAFWLAPPVAVLGVQSGVVTAIPGATALTGILTTLFANPANPAAVVAAQLASALDTATKTAIATVAPPPATMVPIS
jgi:hypothetical protein